MYEYVYKYFWDGNCYFAKKQKTGKRTHFAVTKGGESTYKEFFVPFCALVQIFVVKLSKPCGISTGKIKKMTKQSHFGDSVRKGFLTALGKYDGTAVSCETNRFRFCRVRRPDITRQYKNSACQIF